MPDEELERSFVTAVSGLSRHVRQRFDTEAEAVGLTFSRARLLTVAHRRPGLTQAELAEAMDVRPPTMKRLLDGLEASGLIERRPRDGDRRCNVIYLTDAALRDAGSLFGFLGRLTAEMLGGVSEDELRAALAVLERASANLGR